jgi:integrase
VGTGKARLKLIFSHNPKLPQMFADLLSMASIIRRRGAKVWTAFFRDANGIQHCRSTYLCDKKAAQRVADAYEHTSRFEQSLRQISQVLAEMRELAGNRHTMVTLRGYAASWLAEKKPEVAPATFTFYSQVVRDFLGHLGEAADHDIALISKAQLAAYRSHVAASVSASTANHHMVAVRMLFRAARRDSVIADDPAEFLSAIKEGKPATGQRRPFTLPELEAVMSLADPEWQSMILFGLYTGQRLGDISRLTWGNVDLTRNEIRLVAAKTGRQVILPLAAALRSHIESLQSADDLSSPIHPRAAVTSKITLSSQFAQLLVQAGLRTSESEGRGGSSSRRRQFELSYHCLRHTTVSLLHASGVAQDVSETFAGHASSAVHRLYIHSDRESLQRAADLLPTLHPRRG